MQKNVRTLWSGVVEPECGSDNCDKKLPEPYMRRRLSQLFLNSLKHDARCTQRSSKLSCCRGNGNKEAYATDESIDAYIEHGMFIDARQSSRCEGYWCLRELDMGIR